MGPAHVVPRAVDPLHRLRRPSLGWAIPLLPRSRDPRVAARCQVRRRDGSAVRHLRRAASRADQRTTGSATRRGRPTPMSPGAQRSGPRRSTRSGACCRRRRSPTSASSASGQGFEQLLLRMRASAAARGAELRGHHARRAPQGDPELPRQGRQGRRGSGAGPSTSRRTSGRWRTWPGRCSATSSPSRRPAVTLVDWDPAAEDKAVAAMLWPVTNLPEHQVRRAGRPALRRGEAGDHQGLRRRPHQPAPQARPRPRAGAVPLRRALRLRRLPRSPAPPDDDHRVAAARSRARLGHAGRRRRGRGRASGTPRRWQRSQELHDDLQPTRASSRRRRTRSAWPSRSGTR